MNFLIVQKIFQKNKFDHFDPSHPQQWRIVLRVSNMFGWHGHLTRHYSVAQWFPNFWMTYYPFLNFEKILTPPYFNFFFEFFNHQLLTFFRQLGLKNIRLPFFKGIYPRFENHCSSSSFLLVQVVSSCDDFMLVLWPPMTYGWFPLLLYWSQFSVQDVWQFPQVLF